MTLNRKLRKLNNKQFAEDIKKYIKASHEFYELKVPELKTLAKRLHEEYSLKDFYKVFNKMWNSGYIEERTLAVYTLRIYKEEFDLTTWNFLRPKLHEMRGWDLIDNVATTIIGFILLKNKEIENDIIMFANGRNPWLKRLAIMSTVPLIKEGEVDLALRLCELNIKENDEHMQRAIGNVLKEIGAKNPELLKNFILKNIHMPSITFSIASENMKELRKMRDIKSLNQGIFGLKSIKKIFGK